MGRQQGRQMPDDSMEGDLEDEVRDLDDDIEDADENDSTVDQD